jgi:hypothetical protein
LPRARWRAQAATEAVDRRHVARQRTAPSGQLSTINPPSTSGRDYRP